MDDRTAHLRYTRSMAGGSVVLITGSTDGIGKQAATDLARAGHHVVVHGRNRPRVDAAVAAVRAAAPEASVDGLSFDLGSLAAVRTGAAAIAQRFPTLAVLVNNAGIFATERVVTEDGVEATLAVNYLGHFLLTELLRPQLRAAGGGLVVHVSSVAHTRGRLHLDDLTMASAWTGYAAYAQSKLAQVMHVLDLANLAGDDGLRALAVHPGVIDTKLLRQGFGPVRGASLATGARALTQLVTGELVPASGSYLADGVVVAPTAVASDVATRIRLREWSLATAGLPA
jgi:NAD(P)-dependent dehydrogenase (short-subunit alcohol dehydrogenase family)